MEKNVIPVLLILKGECLKESCWNSQKWKWKHEWSKFQFPIQIGINKYKLSCHIMCTQNSQRTKKNSEEDLKCAQAPVFGFRWALFSSLCWKLRSCDGQADFASRRKIIYPTFQTYLLRRSSCVHPCFKMENLIGQAHKRSWLLNLYYRAHCLATFINFVVYMFHISNHLELFCVREHLLRRTKVP